ncbi:MAG: trypsin-like peptidase domain-containing protein [Paracoccaceae bacterium]
MTAVRRFWRLAALAAFLTVAGPASAETPLKRLTLRQDLLGWEAVGRVDLGSKGYCTGTLIAPDTVLTAAHCLFDKGQPVDPSAIRFRAGLVDGDSIAQSRIARFIAHPGYDAARPTSVESVRHDAGFLILVEAIPAATAAPFAVGALGPNARAISVVSYAKGRDTALSWERGCSLLGRGSGLMAFDCDVYFGSSGAPVFEDGGGRPRIVSIISSGHRDEAGATSYGMELAALLSDLREGLRTGRGVHEAGAAAPLPRRLGGTASGARFIRP